MVSLKLLKILWVISFGLLAALQLLVLFQFHYKSKPKKICAGKLDSFVSLVWIALFRRCTE